MAFKPYPTRINSKPKLRPDFVLEDSGREAVVWLVEHGAQVNARDANGQTPMHVNIAHGNLNAIQYLLDHNADVNAKDINGKTPLAVFEGLKKKEFQSGRGSLTLMQVDIKAVEQLLLQHGAAGEIFTPAPGSGPQTIN
jgi:hypothetical protein